MTDFTLGKLEGQLREAWEWETKIQGIALTRIATQTKDERELQIIADKRTQLEGTFETWIRRVLAKATLEILQRKNAHTLALSVEDDSDGDDGDSPIS